MANLIRYYKRTSHPKGFLGKLALKTMNGKQHEALPEWVFAELQIKEDANMLDVGCGGGANVARLLKRCPNGKVTGMDRSKLALDVAHEVNYREVVDKRCYIIGGNINQLQCAKNLFDLVTAFETIYFWPTLEEGLAEVFRVLKPGGTVAIANEMDGLDPYYRKMEHAVGMLIYNIEEITESLKQTGFTDIHSRHDESRHFICVTARKPE